MPKLTIAVYLLLFFGLSAFAKGIALASDLLWFGELGLGSVFWTAFLSRWGLGFAGAALAGAFLVANLWAAGLRSRRAVMILAEDERDELASLREARELLAPFLPVAALLAALFFGSWAGRQWEEWLLFRHASSFGAVDPVFGKDIGFYVFALPVYQFLNSFAMTLVAAAGVAALARYVAEGKIVLTNLGPRMAETARNHLFLLGGLICLAVAARFELRMYGMLSMDRTVAPGPGYADVAAYFPALRALKYLAIASAVLLWASPALGSARYALAGIALLFLGNLGAGMYRGMIQRFIVAPNEIVKESPYIASAIEHTRRAFGIDRVEEREFRPVDDLTAERVRRNDLTIQNIRLWDHGPLLTTYSQLQEIRTYYDFMDVDNDRYMVDGRYRQVMLSPRELNPASLPSRIWINEHLTYTHGYGLTVGPVNRISPEGLPEFFVKDIPPRTSGLRISRPEIYYGEARANYAIVNTRSKEFDYPSGDENIYTTYQGKGGVSLKGLPRKLLFAFRFGEPKIVLSSDLTSESRVLYHRNIRERLQKAAPFLRFDNDPYIVVGDDGRLHWIVDAYTVTDRYPFSEPLP
ncbi:MAG: UPF0182 family protein, partial [Elusimicrobia bacterium]|nr:UPF0182 family protein [Elusimicrobiota bacterium]